MKARKPRVSKQKAIEAGLHRAAAKGKVTTGRGHEAPEAAGGVAAADRVGLSVMLDPALYSRLQAALVQERIKRKGQPGRLMLGRLVEAAVAAWLDEKGY